jgi:hypothetical protein
MRDYLKEFWRHEVIVVLLLWSDQP